MTVCFLFTLETNYCHLNYCNLCHLKVFVTQSYESCFQDDSANIVRLCVNTERPPNYKIH